MKTYPLLQSQLGVFLECMSNPESTKYNLACFLKFSKKVEADKLESALYRIMEARPEMRIHFVLDSEGNPMQYIDDDMTIQVKRRSMTESEVKDYIDNHFLRPFDLLSGEPLWRLELIETPEFIYVIGDAHHSISDGITISSNFSTCLAKAYNGEELEINEYGLIECAADEQASFETEAYQRAKAYYAEKFAGTDFVNLCNSSSSPWGETITESACTDQTEVDVWCKEHGTNASMLFMAAFSYVLSIVSREERVAYYTVNHGRMDKRLTSAFGMFVKSTPILANADPSQKVIDFIRGFRAELMSTIRYGVYPFDHFCRDLHMTPSASFVFNAFSVDTSIKIEDECVYGVELAKGKSDSDLLCRIFLQEGKYEIRLDASNALYDKRMLYVYAHAILTALQDMMSKPESPLGEVVISAEEEELTVLGKGHTMEYDTTEALTDIMRRKAKEVPDNTLLVFKDRKYTYKQVEEITDRLAAHLVNFGLKHEEAVGVMIERSELLFIYSMSVMKAGGTYMPLDSHFPEERLMFMCEDAGVRIILSDDGLVQRVLPNYQGTIFEQNQLSKLPDIEGVEFPMVKPEDRMVILFTSGSTGKPKGVELEHHNIVNFSHWYAREYELTPADRVAAYANYGFDCHMLDMYPTMLAGATIYIIPEEKRLDLMAISDFLDQNEISVVFFTTVIGCQISTLFENKTLRVMATGGEKMSPVEAKSYRLINGYGPTECSIYSTRYEVKSHFEGEFIGTALDNYQLYVIDQNLHLVPDGVAGELLIAGTGVARGYLNRPDLTAEKFIDFMGQHSYRSGDLVRWAVDPRDGSRQIEFLGRIDGQVKLRGLRIELGEIENRVAAYPGIGQTCVVVKEVGGVPNLVCYYTEKESVDTDALKAFIGETLTAFMVPEVYMKLDKFPLNPNGKINRKVLPVPETKVEEIIAPETNTERQLFEIAAKLLKHDQFGVTSNLITMGLTSLSAMRLSAILQREIEIAVPVTELLATPTIREIAQGIDSDKFKSTKKEVHEKREYYSITENQRGIYVDWEMNHDSTQYNIPAVETFAGVSGKALADALRKVVEAHPYLKTHLRMIDGDLVQVRRDEAPTEVLISQLEVKPDKDFFYKRIRPFNVLEEDLYRFEIYEYGGETWLFRDMHHLIFDGTSNLIFMQELKTVLEGGEIQTESYTAYDNALLEAEMMQSSQYQEAEAYFDNLINGVNSTVYPHSAVKESDRHQFNAVSVFIDKADIEKLRREEGITGHSYFLTVVEQALHSMTGEKDVQLMTIHNGRTDMRMMDIMGMFVKTVPVVSHLLTQSETMIDAAKENQNQFLKTRSYYFYPYTHVVTRHGLSAQIMYNYIEMSTVVRTENEERPKLETAKYPLAFDVYEYANCYEVEVGYDQSLYCADDMRLLGYVIKNLAAGSAKVRKAPLATLPVMDEKMLEETLTISSGESIAFDFQETFVKEFRRQAARIPDNPAVVDKSGTLTYSQLDSQSDALADVLLSKGVEKNSFVGILLDRTKEFPLSILAIHKAGAAYLPIDIDYPIERINYMLTDSQTKVVLTTREVSAALRNDKGIDINGVDLLCLDELCLEGTTNAIDKSEADGIAYMIYTSGSTGVPKGCVLHQRGLRNFTASIALAEELTENDIIASHRSFSFDAHIGDIFPILSAGGQLHIMPAEIRQDLNAIYHYIIDHKVTGTGGTTSLMAMLINTYDLPLRFITAGGEKLFGVQSDKMKIINLYGPTECTNDSTLYVIEPGCQIENIPIGRPMPNTQSLILSPYGQPLPAGVAGELCITGVQVGNGYWKKPELTEAAFVKNPFGEGMLYHTGDMARYNADGQIEYLGRIDSQVKLRGYRIDLGEVESHVADYKGVSQSVASVVEVNGSKHLVCFYVEEQGCSVDKKELAAFLDSTSLAKYMLPEFFVKLDVLPTLPNGKVNRKALPVPEIEAAALENVAPATTRETKLLNIVHELLGRTDFGVTDGLRELGMTSLTAIKLAARASQEGIILKAGDIMHHNTIRSVSKAMMALVSWFEPYQEQKPILVYVSGIVTAQHSLPRLERLSKLFNILEIEAIDEHYKYVFTDNEKMDEVAMMYYDMTDALLPSDAVIGCFMGFSMGGSLAYRMASLYFENKGIMPQVVLGDTVPHYPVYDTSNPEDLENETNGLRQTIRTQLVECGVLDNDALDERVDGELELALQRFKIALTVTSGYESQPLSCQVLLFNALKKSNKDSLSMEKWPELVSSLEVVDIDDSHLGFCDDMSGRWLDIVCDSVINFIGKN